MTRSVSVAFEGPGVGATTAITIIPNHILCEQNEMQRVLASEQILIRC